MTGAAIAVITMTMRAKINHVRKREESETMIMRRLKMIETKGERGRVAE